MSEPTNTSREHVRRERLREYARNWARRNRDKERERKRANPEKQREYTKRWKRNNPEAARASARKTARQRNADGLTREQRWARKNPDKVRERALKYHYGIDLAEYRRMYEAQGGLCAICRRPETATCGRDKPRSLSVDHHHGTSKVRALLCARCNRCLGNWEDSADLLRAALAYLEKTT